MASKKKKPAKKRHKDSPRKPRDWPVVRARCATAIIALVLIGAGGAWVLGLGPLRSFVAKTQDGSPTTVTLRINWPMIADPNAASDDDAQTHVVRMPYVGRDRARMIEAVALQQVSADPFDLGSLRELCEYIERTGWAKAGVSATRLPGDIVEIEAQWRYPSWVVRRAGSDYVIGDDYGLLPLVAGAEGESFRFLDGTALRYITGELPEPPRDSVSGLAYGVQWPGTSLRDAVHLLEFLQPEADIWWQVAGVRIEPGAWENELVIVTDTGSRIIWGRPPGEGGGLEISDDVKLAHLKAAKRHTGRIDWRESLIDVRTEQFEIDRTAQSE
ncbi:MAG: hypothetical protein KAS72_01900 [Phycisphaerales bacterium]|nr:hypothetical protein [Phycisphaerales bacterium]